MIDVTQEAFARHQKEIEDCFKKFEILLKRFDETEQEMGKYLRQIREYDMKLRKKEKQNVSAGIHANIKAE